MTKNTHEFRDPIHVFIKVDSHEREVIDTLAFQRLRNIHHLAMTYLVYPGATHRRFEHSLGVMDVATRIFDVVTDRQNVTDEVRDLIPEITREDDLRYWRRVLRMAALCHDIGHLPFSHAAEKELLPPGYSHETLTAITIKESEIGDVLKSSSARPHLNVDDVVKIAIGPKEASKMDPEIKYSDWEAIISDIIVSDVFGADRIDYLLRDSHHSGVAYGRFDYHRLIDTLRILRPPPAGKVDEESNEPHLGIEKGGLHTAESLILARYFMYSQLYFHHVRRAYDIHLKDFMLAWLPDSKYPISVNEHIGYSDNEVLTAIHEASKDNHHIAHDPACLIVNRGHFRRLWERNPTDIKINREAGSSVFKAICEKFGKENVRRDFYEPKAGPIEFPVKDYDERVVSSTALSEVLGKIHMISVDSVYVNPNILKDAKAFLSKNRQNIIRPGQEEDDNG